MPHPIKGGVHTGSLIRREIMETGDDPVVHKIPAHVRLIGGERSRLSIGGAGAQHLSAGYRNRALVGRRVTYPVAIGEAVVVGTPSLKTVIKSKIMTHLVCQTAYFP